MKLTIETKKSKHQRIHVVGLHLHKLKICKKKKKAKLNKTKNPAVLEAGFEG